jgi:hypothetical protein
MSKLSLINIWLRIIKLVKKDYLEFFIKLSRGRLYSIDTELSRSFVEQMLLKLDNSDCMKDGEINMKRLKAVLLSGEINI